MKVVALVGDLITASRISEAASRAGAEYVRVDGIDQLPAPSDVDLLFVDWDLRAPNWGHDLVAWRGDLLTPTIVLFGPHANLDAHADAASAGLGPMWARSRLVRDLPRVVKSSRRPSS